MVVGAGVEVAEKELCARVEMVVCGVEIEDETLEDEVVATASTFQPDGVNGIPDGTIEGTELTIGTLDVALVAAELVFGILDVALGAAELNTEALDVALGEVELFDDWYTWRELMDQYASAKAVGLFWT